MNGYRAGGNVAGAAARKQACSFIIWQNDGFFLHLFLYLKQISKGLVNLC
jgi:hypothetical protein